MAALGTLGSMGHVPTLIHIGNGVAPRVPPGLPYHRVPEQDWRGVETLTPALAQ